MSNLSDELKNKAILLGLCEEWQREWGSPSFDQLVDKYLRGIHWCMERSFPNLELTEGLESRNIFSRGDHFVIHDHKVVVRGSSDVSVFYDMMDAGDVYVGNDSHVSVCAYDDSVVTVHAYQNAKVTVRANQKAKVYIYLYGGSVEILEDNGLVNIIDKRNEANLDTKGNISS